MKLGDVLKKERSKRGASKEEMAKLLGISEREYLSIEAGGMPRSGVKKLIEWGERSGLGFQELDDYP